MKINLKTKTIKPALKAGQIWKNTSTEQYYLVVRYNGSFLLSNMSGGFVSNYSGLNGFGGNENDFVFIDTLEVEG